MKIAEAPVDNAPAVLPRVRWVVDMLVGDPLPRIC